MYIECQPYLLFLCYIETARRFRKRQVLLVLFGGFAECGNRKTLKLKAQGVYSCK